MFTAMYCSLERERDMFEGSARPRRTSVGYGLQMFKTRRRQLSRIFCLQRSNTGVRVQFRALTSL